MPDRLVNATTELANKVDQLAHSLTIVDEQAQKTARLARRERVLTRWSAILSALALVAAGLSLYTLHEVKDAQVVNCQNANKTRAAQRSLWLFLFDATFEQNPNIDPAQKRFLTDFEAWVKDLFQPHDCNDLGRNYPIPGRPAIPAPKQ